MLYEEPILIVDDQQIVRKVLGLMLKQLGYSLVFEATNGEEAKKIVQDHAPSLIICDINMSPTNGLEFLKELRSGSLGEPEVPVIFLTCNTDNSTIQEAAALGANGYLAKPVKAEKLQQTINALMAEPTDDDSAGK